MQPILSIAAPVPCLALINGRLAGEAGPAEPLLLPVSAWGALFVSLQPLEPGFLPLARRITLSEGRVLPESLAEDVFALAWPGGVTELELTPPGLPAREERLPFRAQGIAWTYAGGPNPRLELGELSIPRPEGASPPELSRWGRLLLFSGAAGEASQYLAAAPEDGSALAGLVTGASLEREDPLLRALVPQADLVGHAEVETWRLEEDALSLESREPVWEEGAPRWPQTPEDTALAALQAAFLGLEGEAEGYLSPQLQGRGLFAPLTRDFEGCAPLKYPLPGAGGGPGLLRRTGERSAEAVALRWRASPREGPQGPWQLDQLEV